MAETLYGPELDALNARLKEAGMLPLMIIDPAIVKGQRVNARYMSAETMKRLTENIRAEGTLESVPLVYVDDAGDVWAISGHHRTESAVKAGIRAMLVMVASPRSEEEIRSKQLAHNALAGEDDKVILAEMFNSIKDLELRLRSGLNDEIAKVNIESLNFKLGGLQEFVIMFLPTDVAEYDETMEKLAQGLTSTSKADVRLASAADWDKFATVLRKVKRYQNIKSNGTALAELVRLANERLSQLIEERNEATAKAA